MPERSFGRTVRYRRTKLGLSQVQLGELVGRSSNTIKSWERDASAPNDPKVVSTLAAVLDFDEQALFEKAGISVPEREESEEGTVEQALASLAPEEEAQALAVVPESLEDPMSGLEVDISDVPDSESEPSAGPIEPIYTYSTEALINTTHTQPVVEVSYMEDRSQRQLYRVRSLATVVILVGLVIVLLWSYTNAFDALSAWWDELTGSLRL